MRLPTSALAIPGATAEEAAKNLEMMFPGRFPTSGPRALYRMVPHDQPREGWWPEELAAVPNHADEIKYWREHAEALDKNWATVQEMTMRAMREALGMFDATVPEMVEEIGRLKAELKAAKGAASGDAVVQALRDYVARLDGEPVRVLWSSDLAGHLKAMLEGTADGR